MFHRMAAVSVSFLLIFAGRAAAQVDPRVQQNQPVPGHALDANTQVGSSGFNLDRPGLGQVNSANAIITGNVTGLAGFHNSYVPGQFGGPAIGGPSVLSLAQQASQFNTTGLTGLGSSVVNDPNMFGAYLPSANLSYFQRRSYGVTDRAAPLAPYGSPQYYYGRAETVVNVGGIRAGQNQPGSSTLATPYTQLNNPMGNPSNGKALPNGVTDDVDRRVQAANPLDAPVPGLSQGLTTGSPSAVTADQSQYIQAVQSPLFGPGGGAGRPPVNVAERSYSARAGQPGQPEVQPPPAEASQQPAGGTASPGIASAAFPPVSNLQQTPLAPPTPAEGTAGAPGRTPQNLGTDRFADLFGAVRAASAVDPEYRSYVNPVTDNTRPSGMARVAADAAAAATDDAGRVRDVRRARFADHLGLAASWARQLLDQPITTFVGNGDNAVNRYLRSAEDSLHGGDYYRAAEQFGMASMIDPQNPLPLFGRGHALAAAGDYLSAVYYLQRGIAQFPEIVSFRLDLVSLIGRQDAFDIRRADLEQQLSHRDSFELRFLLGYLEYYSGVVDVGFANLKKAAEKAPPDSIIARFPDLLRGQGKISSSKADVVPSRPIPGPAPTPGH